MVGVQTKFNYAWVGTVPACLSIITSATNSHFRVW